MDSQSAFSASKQKTGQKVFKKKTNSKLSKSKVKPITCQGCLENQPNQLAHMEYGGCLYSEEYD